MYKFKTRMGYSPEGKQNIFICTLPENTEEFIESIAYEILRDHNCVVWYNSEGGDIYDTEVLYLPEDLSLVVIPVCDDFDMMLKNNPLLIEKKDVPVLIVLTGEDDDIALKVTEKLLECGVDKGNILPFANIYDSEEFGNRLDLCIINLEAEMQIKAAFDVYIYLKCIEAKEKNDEKIAPLKDSYEFENYLNKLLGLIYKDKNKYDILYSYLRFHEYETMYHDVKLEDLLPDIGASKADVMKILLSGSEDGDVHNLFIGYAYYKGRGVEKDWNKAFEFISKASDDGYTEAMQILLDLYWDRDCDLEYDEKVEKRFDLSKKLLNACRLKYKYDRNEENTDLLADVIYDYCRDLMDKYKDFANELNGIKVSMRKNGYEPEEIEEEIEELAEEADGMILEIICTIKELEDLYIPNQRFAEEIEFLVSRNEYIRTSENTGRYSQKEIEDESEKNSRRISELAGNMSNTHLLKKRYTQYDVAMDVVKHMNIFNGKPNRTDKFYIKAQDLWGYLECTLKTGEHTQFFENALEHSHFCACVDGSIESKRNLVFAYFPMCNTTDDEEAMKWLLKALDLQKSIFEETHDLLDCRVVASICRTVFYRCRDTENAKYWKDETLRYYELLHESIPDDILYTELIGFLLRDWGE